MLIAPRLWHIVVQITLVLQYACHLRLFHFQHMADFGFQHAALDERIFVERHRSIVTPFFTLTPTLITLRISQLVRRVALRFRHFVVEIALPILLVFHLLALFALLFIRSILLCSSEIQHDLLAPLHHLLFFFLELLIFHGLERFGNARRPQPAGAEAADVLLALLDCVLVVCEG